MSRPTDWAPLAEKDPVPGDPGTVGRLGKHHTDVAITIREQVRILKRLADQDGWKSDAGREFSKKAREASEELDRVNERYKEAGSALTAWVAPLEQAQSESVLALRLAQEAERKMKAFAPGTGGGGGSAPAGATPAQAKAAAAAAAAAERQRAANYNLALAELEAAKRQLQDVKAERDEQARKLAKRIRDVAENDDLKDSWLDRRKNWVVKNAVWIKGVVDILGAVALALAVLAVVFTAGWIVVAAAIVAGLMAVGNAALFAAGEGPWWAVALDLLGLGLLGAGIRYGRFAGRYLKDGLRRGVSRVRGKAKDNVKVEQPRKGRGQRAPVDQKTRSQAGSRDRFKRAEARRKIDQAKKDEAAANLRNARNQAAANAEAKLLSRLRADPALAARLKSGDAGIAETREVLDLLERAFPRDMDVLRAIARARSAANAATAATWAGHALTVAQTGMSVRQNPPRLDMYNVAGSSW